MRVLDRRRGPNPPRLIAIDPRPTPVALEADLHLAIKNGTNLALLNALTREIIANGWIDHDYIRHHTVGYEELKRWTRDWTPEKAAEICGIPAEQIREAARLIGNTERLFQIVLQGVYQSHQATATAVQVNNINLIRGMLGKPGCGVLQTNGQPTAQNTRETGYNGDLPGFSNSDNDAHVEDLARVWNVDPMTIPHYSKPMHVMQIFRFAEQSTIKFLPTAAPTPPSPCPSCTASAPSSPNKTSSSSCRTSSSPRPPDSPTLSSPPPPGARRPARSPSRPHRPPLRESRRAARRGEGRPRHLHGLRAEDGLQRQERPTSREVEHPGGDVRGVEGVLA